MPGRFPFGRPVTACGATAVSERNTLILGAYPSALHVKWSPPPLSQFSPPLKPIKAIAVDNEPEVFWTGHDEVQRIEEWRHSVGWQASWGTVEPVGSLNGSSGVWVRDRVLCPLHLRRDQVWMGDCLDTYRLSKGATTRIKDTVIPAFAVLNVDPPDLLPHPAEDEIVRESLASHTDRLQSLINAVNPRQLITLGNAALRIIRDLVVADVTAPTRLSVDPHRYANPVSVRFKSGRPAEWLPLAHPASPRPYQLAHDRWIESRLAAT